MLDFVGDARALPALGAELRDRVRAATATGSSTTNCAIDLRVDRRSAAVDHPACPPPPCHGAFSRVVPNGDGSEYLFTLFFPDGTEEAAITRQMTIVEEELRTVRALCEQRREPGARGGHGAGACDEGERQQLLDRHAGDVGDDHAESRSRTASWRRIQYPSASLRPSGARSSHWYMPHIASRPRA